MSLRNLTRGSVCLALTIALSALPALPAGGAPWSGSPGASTVDIDRNHGGGLWAAFWAYLGQIWAKEGSSMDPDGTPQAGSPWSGPWDQEGPDMDPNGNPQSGSSWTGPSDHAGPDMDPNGNPSDQAGSSMDPNG